LKSLGFKIWFAPATLKVGDSLYSVQDLDMYSAESMSKPYFEADKPALIELKRLSPTLRVAGANHILNPRRNCSLFGMTLIRIRLINGILHFPVLLLLRVP
jgi:hypothetical protein